MPTYGYICRVCGVEIDVDELLAEDTRHIGKDGVCGTLRRDWSSVNVSTSNLKRARR